MVQNLNSDRSAAQASKNSHNVVKICGFWRCIVEVIQALGELYEETRLVHGGTTYATHTETSGHRCRSLVPGPWDGAPGRGARGPHQVRWAWRRALPVSCTDAAQAQFHRAMALYHSFDWPRGKAAFDEIASLDPRCGMAYWGLAMVAADNPFGWPISLKLQGRGRGDPESPGHWCHHAARARLHRGARGALQGPCDGAAPAARPGL